MTTKTTQKSIGKTMSGFLDREARHKRALEECRQHAEKLKLEKMRKPAEKK